MPTAKLTNEQAGIIKETTGISFREIARRYGVSIATVNDIKHNRRWKRVLASALQESG